jgi:HEPN domain-containing protein
MLKSKRYLYVGFMAHQSIEKILKAYYVKVCGETAPFSHSLSYLAKKAKIYEQLSEAQKLFIDLLEPLNIECRYPSHKK